MIQIAKEEFQSRVQQLKARMKARGMDACLIYGDEYRKENLRYISNYWPIFERGAVIVPLIGEPIVLAAPEGEQVCLEMSAWPDIRLIPDFACVTVPDEIEYPFANYTDFKSVFQELNDRSTICRLGLVGKDAMSHEVFLAIYQNLSHAEMMDANDLLHELRLIKSQAEIACLEEAARIADIGYQALMDAATVGATEREAAAAAYYAAFQAGAEDIPFCLVSSGRRVDTIIGRHALKRIEDGDMVMAALAVQYEGYVATVGFPFVAGTMSDEQAAFIDLLIEANERAVGYIRPGAKQGALVQAVKQYFNEMGVTAFDLYPPLHGCGVAEAEMPYPNENSTGIFTADMTVNTDVSLFGHPHGSNRVEEGFIITEHGCQPMSHLVRRLTAEWKIAKQAKNNFNE